jgi:predicted 2-oxoglutarate/Fe(II)-dependent dioxygenase YbiX/peroxiredoxin
MGCALRGAWCTPRRQPSGASQGRALWDLREPAPSRRPLTFATYDFVPAPFIGYTDVANNTTTENRISLGDPVPWFSAPLVSGGSFILHVHAGRWIVLCFLGSPANPRVREELAALLNESSLFDEDRLIVRGVFTAPPDDVAQYPEGGSKALSFLADYDGAISRSFGALEMPRTIVLDPMLRVIADIPWDFAQGHAATVRGLLRSLPSIDDSAGVPMSAPALIVPRVLNFELCDFLVRLYEQQGGEDSGFLVDVGAKTMTMVDYRLKRRNDLVVAAPELRELIGGHVVRRLLPAVERYFQFQATRMDRYIIACYDSEIGGHFYRHRDNVNAGAQHRRFAVTLNLNSDYDGCDLLFPEFGRKTYRAPHGGALVFSCGALHQVTPITRGRRYAFLAFLYSEADAAKREANNTRLHEGETLYTGAGDRLIPEKAVLTA